jgi:hypothetical protein
MQIQLTITESFGDVVSFAEFANALQGFLAGHAHTVVIGKGTGTETSTRAVEAATPRPAAPAPTPAELHAENVAASLDAPDPMPAAVPAEEAPKKRRGRPPQARVDDVPSAPPALVDAAPVEPDPFADSAAFDPAAAPVAKPSPLAAISYDVLRRKVMRFIELRPDRAAAYGELTETLKAHGYTDIAAITNDRPGETPAAKGERVALMVAKLDEMIASAEAAAADAKAAKAK